MFKNFSSWAIGLQIPLVETIEIAKAVGFQGFDINIGETKRLLESSSLEEVNKTINKSGLKKAGWGLPIDFRRDKETYVKGLEMLHSYADIANNLGFQTVFTYIKPFSDELSYDKPLQAEALDTVASSIVPTPEFAATVIDIISVPPAALSSRSISIAPAVSIASVTTV